MRKWFSISIIIILLIGVIAGVLPWVSGRIVEHELNAWVPSFKSPNYEFHIVDYQRGWYRSEATIQLRLVNQHIIHFLRGGDNTRPIRVNIHYVIHHGPVILPGIGRKLSSPFFGLAYAECQVDFPKNSTLKPYVNYRTIATGNLSIGFSQALHTVLKSRGFSFMDQRRGVTFTSGPVKVDTDYYPKEMNIRRTGDYQKLSMTYDGVTYTVNNVQTKSNLAIGKYNLQMGDYGLVAPFAKVEHNKRTLFLAKNLLLKYNRRIVAHVVDTLFSFSLDELQLYNAKYGPVSANIITNNLDGRTLAAINQLFSEYYLRRPGAEESQYYYDRFYMLLPNLISRGFQLQVSPLELQMPSGDFSMTAVMTFPDIHKKPLVDLGRLYRKANISLEISIPKPILRRFLTHYFYLQKQYHGVTVQLSEVSKQASQFIEGLESIKLLIPKNNTYKFMASYKGGEVYINAQLVTLDSLIKDHKSIQEIMDDKQSNGN